MRESSIHFPLIYSRIWKSDKFVQNVADGWDARCPEGEFLFLWQPHKLVFYFPSQFYVHQDVEKRGRGLAGKGGGYLRNEGHHVHGGSSKM